MDQSCKKPKAGGFFRRGRPDNVDRALPGSTKSGNSTTNFLTPDLVDAIQHLNIGRNRNVPIQQHIPGTRHIRRVIQPDPFGEPSEPSADMNAFFAHAEARSHSSHSPQNAIHNRGREASSGRGFRGSTRGSNYHSDSGQRQTHAMGFKKLEELVKSNEPEEFVLKISTALEAFTLLLEEDLSNDYVVLIMMAMAKLSESSFDQKKIQLLHITCKEKFRNRLQRFIMEVILHDKEDKWKSKYFWNEPDSFFNNTHKYCEMLLRMIPSTALSVLSKLLKACMYAFPNIPNLPENICIIFEDIQNKFILCQEEMERKKARGEEPHIEETEPPDNFREISLFPLPYEITTYNKPFLRENIITGAYRSVEHYLDVQFRLVRNDFVKPLRDGISRYMDKLNGDGRKVQNIKLYHKVRFLKPQLCSNATNGYMIQLPTTKGKKLNIKMENSRMFMYGTLVCFTKDNFRQISFGRIVDRKIELLKEGRLVVALESVGDKVDYGADYLMVECKVYFEPYYYVLKALQVIEESTFPMMNYIVYMDPTSDLPDYLVQAGERGLLPLKYRIPVENGLLNPYQWPSAATLKLNEAQYAAYKNALTREFAIIQGPPGTGKTYLGLKVAGTILANKTVWHKNQSPMLVICYTNHALDQFLEGILKFTTKIVRIGGQSKNKNLDAYNIRMARKHGYARLIHEEFGKVKSQALELKMMYDLLDATKDFKGVVDISKMLRQLPELAGSWFGGISGDSLKKWLFGGVNLLGQRRTMEDEINEVMKIAGILNDETALGQDSDEDEDFEAAFQAIGTGEEHKADDDDDDITIGYKLTNFYLSSVNTLQSQMDKLKEEALYMRQYAVSDPNYRLDEKRFQNLEMEYRINSEEFQYLQMRMEEGAKMPGVLTNILPKLDLRNPENIHPDDRWRLYFQWLHQYRGHLLKSIKKEQEIYKELHRAYEEVKEIADVEMMRSMEVVGMTTTSAARLQATLRALRSRIVIVEEAAEIMEAHIVTALTKNCEHLILIGDHQQLRPSTADYEMETKYNLGISLFERMVRNKIHCNVLEIQHRMRPDISKLIVPTIYPNLTDHESVHLFPNVKGIDRNLFFIDHRNAENAEKDESKYNMHEVKYMLALAQYILQNGYEPSDVTILCAYSAQLFKMFKERKNYPLLDNVRICVLDNYQGEESKIILLSLVRNNQERKIGFLKIENRVCVALSRAREGFYIMGNMAMLSENAEIWRHIKKTLEDQDSLGHALPVRCQIHKATVTLLETIDDFHKVAEGGCDQPCNQMLTCEHVCKMQCHILNREHDDYKCKENCKEVLCDDGHICPKKCFEECGSCQFPMLRSLPCGHHNFYPCHQTEFKCHIPVSSNLPCGHTVDNKPCYMKPEDFPCPFPCDTRIEKCGHACLLTCHIRKDPDHISYACRKKCDRVRPDCMAEEDEQHRCQKLCYEDCDKCDVVVKKTRSCSHVYNLQCSADVETMIQCRRPCKKKLACGHHCKQDCCDECGNCLVKVDKKIEECGHTMKMMCKDIPSKKMCSGRCPVILSCSHQCQNICKVQCTKDCNQLVDSIVPLICGHTAKIPCYLSLLGHIVGDSKLVDYCRNPCRKELKCGHSCSGSCGECYQGRIHQVCMSNCGVTLVCGHVCKTPCREVCPPCTEKCIYRCSHSKCNKNCGEPCTNCQERCDRRCIHQECRAKCHKPCTVPPCDAPCEKLLKCGHECVGFCGDPCPPLCRVCDNEELTEIFFGDEDEKFARYVLLEDCKHVFETGGLDTWLESSDEEIGVKSCPRCKTPIVNTMRFSDHIKHTVKSMTNVKQKFYGLLKSNVETGKRAIAKLDLLLTSTTLQKECPVLDGLGKALKVRLQPIKQNKRQMLSKTTVQIAEAKIQVLENICNLYDDVQRKSRFKLTPPCANYIQFLISRLAADLNRMTEQEIDDYKAELMRLRRMLWLDFLECRFGSVRTSLRYVSLQKRIYSTSKYDVDNDGTIKADLKELSQSIGGLDVSESELKEIVKVIGVRSGAWYKCPNGHPYAIGDCGGAMVVSKCADCGAPIGGQNHTLTAGNAHFALDGSRHAAWSEQNNLLNYQFPM